VILSLWYLWDHLSGYIPWAPWWWGL